MGSSGSIPPNFHGGDFGGLNSSSNNDDSFFDALLDIEILPSLLSDHDDFDVSEVEFGDIEIRSDPPSSHGSADAQGKKRGGRRKKTVTREQLLNGRKRTIKEAANEIGVSESTIKRRCREHFSKGWSEVQESASVSLCKHKEGRMQDQDKVVVQLHYKGRNTAFELPLKAKVRQLHKDIKASLNLCLGKYDITYFDGNKKLSIVGDPNLKHCMSLASQSPHSPFKFIELTVEDVDDQSISCL